jgi:L-ascorbate metabolism protein UlaG (beta-lactamase superfamily)
MSRDGLTYVGHSSVLIEIDGSRVLTDPVLRSRVGYIRRIVPPPSPDVGSELDAILISHAHHDHLDMPSLRRLPATVPVVAPPTCAQIVRKTGREVIEAAAGASVRVGSLDVLAVPAEHDGRRLPIGADQPAVGYVIGSGPRICFFGDTDLFDAMGELAGELDVALLPIWGWGPRTGPGHLDPEGAARAVALLRPRVAVPVHWGTYASPRVWWRADPRLPAREFERLVALHAPGVDVSILAPGESAALRSAASRSG